MTFIYLMEAIYLVLQCNKWKVQKIFAFINLYSIPSFCPIHLLEVCNSQNDLKHILSEIQLSRINLYKCSLFTQWCPEESNIWNLWRSNKLWLQESGRMQKANPTTWNQFQQISKAYMSIQRFGSSPISPEAFIAYEDSSILGHWLYVDLSHLNGQTVLYIVDLAPRFSGSSTLDGY